MELLQRLRDPFNVTPQDAAEAADEIERLREALGRANTKHEHFEREWYLRGDEIERLREALEHILKIEPTGGAAAHAMRSVAVNALGRLQQKDSE